MTATAYILTTTLAKTLVNGTTVMAVNANSEAEAEAMAASYFDGDSNASWTAPTAGDINTAPNDWEDFVARVVVSKTGETTIDVSVTGASEDGFSDLMDALVVALNATVIDHAAFDTDTLTVASSADTDDDDIGDWTVEFYLTAPNGASLEDLYVDSITDGGTSTSQLEVVLVADGTLSRSVSPTVVSTYG